MSTVKCTNIEALTGGGAPDNLLPVTCSAWVNFDGTGTVAIRDSYNVSSITDSGTGTYVVNYATNLADVNYSISYATDSAAFAIGAGLSIYNLLNVSSQLTTGVTLSTYSYTGSINTTYSQDAQGVFVQIFGGQ